MTTTISNPPYNIKWQHPIFAQSLPEYELGLPPESNANFAFILKSFHVADEAILILPSGVLNPSHQEEIKVIKNLVNGNFIHAVILLPGNMFESTDIATCILWLKKKRQTTKIAFVDLREKVTEEVRLQNGQHGKTQTKRTYQKTFNVLSDEIIQEVTQAIENQEEKDYLKFVSTETIKANDYTIRPQHYMKPNIDFKYRDLEDIVNDLNRVTNKINSVKLTIGQGVAKSLDMLSVCESMQQGQKLSKANADNLKDIVKTKIIKENQLSVTRSRELKIEVADFEQIPELIILFLNSWKQYHMMLNNEQNRILAELRDALTHKLLSGEIEL